MDGRHIPKGVTVGVQCPHCTRTFANPTEVAIVTCIACKKVHKELSESYLLFAGNVYVGVDGGLIGNNLDDDGAINRATVVCRDMDCLSKVLQVPYERD